MGEQEVAEFIIANRLSPTYRVMPQYMWDITPLSDEDLVFLLTQHLMCDTVAMRQAVKMVEDHKLSKKWRLGYK